MKQRRLRNWPTSALWPLANVCMKKITKRIHSSKPALLNHPIQKEKNQNSPEDLLHLAQQIPSTEVLYGWAQASQNSLKQPHHSLPSTGREGHVEASYDATAPLQTRSIPQWLVLLLKQKWRQYCHTNNCIQTHERFKIRLFIRTRQNQKISGVTSFVKLSAIKRHFTVLICEHKHWKCNTKT